MCYGDEIELCLPISGITREDHMECSQNSSNFPQFTSFWLKSVIGRTTARIKKFDGAFLPGFYTVLYTESFAFIPRQKRAISPRL